MLWLACVTPTGRLGVAAAGAVPHRRGACWLYRGAGFPLLGGGLRLGLLILPDKGVALMYLCFMGLYPVVKSRLEQCASRPWSGWGKLACFNRGPHPAVGGIPGAVPACPAGVAGRKGVAALRGGEPGVPPL